MFLRPTKSSFLLKPNTSKSFFCLPLVQQKIKFYSSLNWYYVIIQNFLVTLDLYLLLFCFVIFLYLYHNNMIININRPVCKLYAPHSILLCSMWRPFPILTFFSQDLFNTEQLPLLYLEVGKLLLWLFQFQNLSFLNFSCRPSIPLSALHVSTSSCLQIN